MNLKRRNKIQLLEGHVFNDFLFPRAQFSVCFTNMLVRFVCEGLRHFGYFAFELVLIACLILFLSLFLKLAIKRTFSSCNFQSIGKKFGGSLLVIELVKLEYSSPCHIEVHRRNPTLVRHRCAQRCDSEDKHSVVTKMCTLISVTALSVATTFTVMCTSLSHQCAHRCHTNVS